MTRGLFALSSIVLLSVAPLAPARAAPPAGDFEQITTRADANGDGTITWSEVVDMRTAIFTRLDRDNNGFVDASDRPRVMAERFDKAFTQLQIQFDSNKDRRVSRAEALHSKSPSFEAGDVNGDRVLSGDEMAALRTRGSAK